MGGAKNCPETPRQKMIGMMYLVLTAMLALNVSADIINGFDKLRHSMESSIVSTSSRTEDIMTNFKAAYSKDEGSMRKYGDWWTIAQAIVAKSDEFYNYIEHFKLDIVNMEMKGNFTSMPEKITAGDDTNKPHQYAINEVDATTGRTHAEEFRVRMGDYRTYMTSADSECIQRKMEDQKFAHDWNLKVEMFNSLFATENVTDQEGNVISWETSVFSEMPASAVYAMLTKYQNDVRTAENDLVNFMFEAAGRSDFVVNSVEAMVMPMNGEYIMQGSHYRARIVSAAVDTNQTPVFFINGKEYTDGIYDIVGSSIGPQTFSGYMLMPDDTIRYPFKGQYTVGAPSATMSNTELNVMYRGYDNKFSISVPGVSEDKLKVTATGATVTKSKDMYLIKPGNEAKEVTVTVMAEVDGRMVQMGAQSFRVRAVPKPGAYFKCGETMYEEGNIPRSVLLNPSAVIVASYPADELLNLPFQIVGFKLNVNGVMTDCKSDRFSKKELDKLSKLKKGAMISIIDISAKGPDGKVVKLRGIPFTLN